MAVAVAVAHEAHDVDEESGVGPLAGSRGHGLDPRPERRLALVEERVRMVLVELLEELVEIGAPCRGDGIGRRG